MTQRTASARVSFAGGLSALLSASALVLLVPFVILAVALPAVLLLRLALELIGLVLR